MNTQLNIPKTIAVGQVKRNDTYTGRLGYVIYKDEKGVLRKETSWQNWRDKTIEPAYYDNTPTEGFVLNKNGGGQSSSRYSDWHTRAAFIRVYDPRDFEFEISVENLLFILHYCDCSRGKGLEGKFVYAWSGKDLVLLPEGCKEYKNSMEFTELKTMKVPSKELTPGCTYHTKNQQDLLYLGKFNYINSNYYGVINFSTEHIFYRASQSFEEFIISNRCDEQTWDSVRAQYISQYERYSKEFPTYNYHQAYTPEKFEGYKKKTMENLEITYNKQKFVVLKPSMIAKMVSDTPDENFALYVHELETSGRVFLSNFIQVISSPVSFNELSNNNKCQYWYQGHEYAKRFIKTGENKYNLVDIRVDITRTNNSSLRWTTNYEYKVNGFNITPVCEITYDGNNFKRKELPKRKSEVLVSQADIEKMEFLDLIIKYNNKEISIR